MKIKLIIPLVFVVAIAGCIGQADVSPEMMEEEMEQVPEEIEEVPEEIMEEAPPEPTPTPTPTPEIVISSLEVEFETVDGWKIKADYYEGEGKTLLILMHMLGRDRTDWGSFPEELSAKYSVLVLDIRGHGVSTTQGAEERTWEDFVTEDWTATPLDLVAAKAFLESEGVDTDRAVIIGASIGANIALRHAANENYVKELVLLSPGVNYRGIMTSDAMARYHGRALLVAAKDDSDSETSVRQLNTLGSAKKKLIIYEEGGHGTNLFKTTDVKDEILSWLI